MGAQVVYQIDSGYFCAGIVVENDKVVRAARILHYMKGWKWERVRRYVEDKGWVWLECPEPSKSLG